MLINKISSKYEEFFSHFLANFQGWETLTLAKLSGLKPSRSFRKNPVPFDIWIPGKLVKSCQALLIRYNASVCGLNFIEYLTLRLYPDVSFPELRLT